MKEQTYSDSDFLPTKTHTLYLGNSHVAAILNKAHHPAHGDGRLIFAITIIFQQRVQLICFHSRNTH
jgi:hypothetical protein